MSYNLTGLENISGFPSFLAINDAVGTLPMMFTGVVFAYVIFLAGKKVTDTQQSLFMALLSLTVYGVGFAIVGVVAWVLPSIAAPLAVMSGIMAALKNKSNTS